MKYIIELVGFGVTIFFYLWAALVEQGFRSIKKAINKLLDKWGK